jgi:hypothetical protein
MANRTIFDQDPDPVRLFEELYEGGVRDYKGLPLGDVAGHAARRFTVCYGAMCLIRVLALLERIPPGASFFLRPAPQIRINKSLAISRPRTSSPAS